MLWLCNSKRVELYFRAECLAFGFLVLLCVPVKWCQLLVTTVATCRLYANVKNIGLHLCEHTWRFREKWLLIVHTLIPQLRLKDKGSICCVAE